MKRFDPMFAIGLVLAAGCLEHEQENLPVNPPHGGQSIVSGSGVVGSPPGTVILLTGRVCLITVNVFALGECAGTGVGGLNVALGGAVAVTGDDGTFTIQAVSQPGLVFRVDGDNIVPAAQALQAINIIPTFSSSLFATVIAQNGISIPPAGGSVMASVTNSAGAPMAGVTATSTPVASSGPFFDGAQPSQFSQNETGNSGIVFFPGLTTLGPASLSFAGSQGQESTIDGVQVFDGGVTFVSAPLD